MKPLAVQGCVLQLTDPTLAAASIEITTPPSGTTKAGKKNAYSGQLQVQVTAITDAAGFAAPSAICTINPGAQMVKIDGLEAVLEMDESEAVTVSFKHPSSGAETTHAVAVRITSAGQDKAQGA